MNSRIITNSPFIWLWKFSTKKSHYRDGNFQEIRKNHFILKDKFVTIRKFNIIIILGAELFHFLKISKWFHRKNHKLNLKIITWATVWMSWKSWTVILRLSLGAGFWLLRRSNLVSFRVFLSTCSISGVKLV